MKASVGKLFALAAAALCLATPAGAHGFGQRYDLPLPLSFYLVGTSAAVVVSFVIVALFVRDVRPRESYPRLDLIRGGGALTSFLTFALRLFGLAALIITVIAGFRGNQDPYRNIAPTLVWIILWVGLAYVSAFAFPIWRFVNPWRGLFEAVETLWRGLTGRPHLSVRLCYPAVLGVWPAFLLLLAFSWVELVYPTPAVPQHIAVFAVGYSVLTFAGMFIFGCETWLSHGEVFCLVFGTFARFAPTELREGERTCSLSLRPFGAGLLDSASVTTSMMAFVILLLSSVLYDGALGTPEWGALESMLASAIAPLGETAFILIRTAGLIVFWLVFIGAYLAVAATMSAITAGRLSPLAVGRAFAFTLVPIAIGYHLAHYLTFLLIQGQYIIPLVSDPFGFGWNLFGTAGYRVDIAIVDARFAWYVAVSAILLGHIAAVYLAHIKAMWVLEGHSVALKSQVPLTALMVVYTFVSLSILAEPIAERRPVAQPTAVLPAEVSIPENAQSPEPGSGRLRPVGPGKLAKSKITYRVLGSAFHDGSRMQIADILYSYMFAYRWGGAGGEVHDPWIASATAAMRERLIAFKVVGTDTTSKSLRFGDISFIRELFVVDVFLTSTPIDAEQDAVVAPPWSTVPWHLIVLMEEAVSRGWAAFSEKEAERLGVAWLDLVRSEALKDKLASLLATFEQEGYRPERLRQLVSREDARKRWAALAAFYKEHGHFLVANGPYRLKSWASGSVGLEAFRDLSYPLGVGSFDAYAVPRRGFITKVARKEGEVTLSADIEVLMKHQRSYDLARTPLSAVPADELKRSAPECRYMVLDSEGTVVAAGQTPLGDDANFHIDLGGKLPAGDFTLVAEILVNGNAMNGEIKRIPLTATEPR
jgi:hypothetical protein